MDETPEQRLRRRTERVALIAKLKFDLAKAEAQPVDYATIGLLRLKIDEMEQAHNLDMAAVRR